MPMYRTRCPLIIRAQRRMTSLPLATLGPGAPIAGVISTYDGVDWLFARAGERNGWVLAALVMREKKKRTRTRRPRWSG